MFLPIVLLILALVLLVAILLLLLNLRSEIQSTGGGEGSGGGSGGSSGAIPDQISGTALAAYFAPRLAGTPIAASGTASAPPASVVWTSGGDQILVHLDSIATQIANQTVLVSVDLECDQTGRTPLVVALSLGHDAQGGLIAATDEFPRGNGALAARWGATVQAAVWSALLSLASDHAAERSMSPLALVIRSGNLHLEAGPALKIA